MTTGSNMALHCHLCNRPSRKAYLIYNTSSCESQIGLENRCALSRINLRTVRCPSAGWRRWRVASAWDRANPCTLLIVTCVLVGLYRSVTQRNSDAKSTRNATLGWLAAPQLPLAQMDG